VILEPHTCGLGFSDRDGTYDESNESRPPGDKPPGDLPYELMLETLLVVIDNVEEAYELVLGPDVAEDTEPAVECKREFGELRDAVSLRLNRSLALPTVCNEGPSSKGGEEARRFWPVVAVGEYGSCRVEYSSM
jgi:hypothetical protein